MCFEPIQISQSNVSAALSWISLCTEKRCEYFRVTVALVVLTLCGFNHVFAQSENSSRPPLQKGHLQAVLDIHWSPNDKLLLTYSAADGYLNIWQMPETKLISSVKDSTIRIKGSDKRFLRAFTWSSDSRLIATGAENGTAQIWEAETGKLLWNTRVAEGFVNGVVFSRDLKYLAAIASPEDEDHKLVLLDAATGKLVKTLGTVERQRFLTYYHDAKIAFSEDNKQLTAGDITGTVTRWDLSGGSLLSTQRLNMCGSVRLLPNSFAYSEDLTRVVARCDTKTLIVDTVTGNTLQELPNTNRSSRAIALSEDNQLLFVDDTQPRVVSLKSGAEIPVDSHFGSCGCDFNSNNTLLAFDEFIEDEKVRVIDLKSGQIVARVEAHPGGIKALAFSPDGTVIASGSEDRVVRIWDANTGELRHGLEGHSRPIEALAFTPDGKLIVSSSSDETLRVWEVATGNLSRTIEHRTEGIEKVTSIAFSRDGRRMVTTHGITITLWDTSDWTRMRAFVAEEPQTSGGATAEAARFDSQDRIISAHEDGTIRIWTTKSASPLPAPYSELAKVIKTADKVESFALSPNEKFLVANNGTESPGIWDWSRYKPLRRLGEDAGYVHRLVFSPDSQFIATSDIGGDILLWSVATGKLLREFDGGYSSNDFVAFSPDGTKLVSGGENQNIIMWDVKTGARLWHILPIRELERPTAAEIAEQQKETARAALEARAINGVVDKQAPKVFVSFSHYGYASNPMAARFGETGRAELSLLRLTERVATGVWLRLHNKSGLPITFATQSMYLDKKCAYETSKKRLFPALCNGAEVIVVFAAFDSKGQSIPSGGGHVHFSSILPPNRSVLFSVPKEFFQQRRCIVITYNFMNEDGKGKLIDYGDERELRLSSIRRLRR